MEQVMLSPYIVFILSFIFSQYIYPGLRLRYDGKPVELVEHPEPDQDFLEEYYPEGRAIVITYFQISPASSRYECCGF